LSYYTCMADRLRSEDFSLCDIASCAQSHWSEIEEVISSVAGQEESERIRERIRVLAEVKGRCSPDGKDLSILSLMVETFLGGLGLSFIDRDVAARLEELYGFFAENNVLTEGRARLWRRVVAEINERLSKGLAVFEGDGATPLLAVGADDLPWALGYVWPLFVEQVRGKGVDAVVDEALSAIHVGRGVELAGPPGTGKLALMYQILVDLSKDGFALYAGQQDAAGVLHGKKVVFTPGGYTVVPAGWSGGVTRIDVEGRLTLGELEEVAGKLASWDGVSLPDRDLSELARLSMGRPAFVELALAYVSLCRLKGLSCELPRSIEDAKAKLREITPREVLDKLAIPASLGFRCFPSPLIEPDESEEAFVDRLLLRYDALSLYSWRSGVSREVFRSVALSPPNVHESVFASESPFHAAWSTVMGAKGAARYITLTALDMVPDEASFQALEAVAVLSPGTLSKLLKDATAFRLEVLARFAENAGSLAVAEELVSKAVGILSVLEAEELRSEREALSLKLAELQVSRLLPELALKTLSNVKPLDEEAEYSIARLKGIAHLNLGQYDEAEKSILEAMRYASSKGLKQDHYYLRILLADAMAGKGRIEEAREKLDEVVKELTREDCGLAGLLFEAAIRQKQLKGKLNYAVCAALTRCGYPDFAGAYGCFS